MTVFPDYLGRTGTVFRGIMAACQSRREANCRFNDTAGSFARRGLTGKGNTGKFWLSVPTPLGPEA